MRERVQVDARILMMHNFSYRVESRGYQLVVDVTAFPDDE